MTTSEAERGTALSAPSFESLLGRPEIIWMGQNTTHLPPPAQVLAAMRASIDAAEFQVYAPALGLSELRRLVVEDLGLANAEAWITNGAVGGLHHICTALAPSISRLVTTDPGWPWPSRFAGLEGVGSTMLPVYSAEQGYKLSPRQLHGTLAKHSLIYLIDPLNPLGSTYTRNELIEITSLARDSESIIIHDCTYRHFAGQHTLAADLYPEGTFTTYSFSKWLGLAGLRLGAVVAQPTLLQRLTEVPSNPLGSSILAQRAAIAGLKNRGPWLAELLAVNSHNQTLITDAVEQSGFGHVLVKPSAANFLAVDISDTGWDSDSLCAHLLDSNIFIRPGTYQSPRFGRNFVKISTSVPTAWAQALAEAWRGLQPAGQVAP